MLAGDLCLLGLPSSGLTGQGTEWAAMLAMNDQITNQSIYWTIKGLCLLVLQLVLTHGTDLDLHC